MALLLPVAQSTQESQVASGLIAVLINYDIATHFSAFFIWGLLASTWPDFQHHSGVRKTVLAIGYAISLEISQGLVPYRTFEWSDLLANLAGTAVGYYVGILAIFHRN